MATKVMQQPWLWKRFTSDAIESYLGSPGEPIIDLRGAAPQLKICDGATLGGVPVSHEVEFAGVATPTIVEPIDSATGIAVQPVLKGSQFNGIASDGSDAVHVASYWEIARDLSFNDYVYQSGRDTTNLTELDMSQTDVRLERLTTYHVRVRYEDESGVASEWSLISSFEVEVDIPDTFIARIRPSDGYREDRYGISVAATENGDTVLVGASRDDDGGADTGSVYVYRLENGSYVEQGKLHASDPSKYAYFGTSVALSGDGTVALIGGHADDDRGTNAGAIYVFHLENGQYVEKYKLYASDASLHDWFGISADLSHDGSVAVVAASRHWGDNILPGSFYVFQLENGQYVEKARVYASDSSATDYFAQSVALSGDASVLLVGATEDDENEPSNPDVRGSFYVFQLENGQYVEKYKVIPPANGLTGTVGGALTLSPDGSLAIVKAYGQAIAYVLTESGYEDVGRVGADRVGDISSFNGGSAAVFGEPTDAANGTNSGAISYYK